MSPNILIPALFIYPVVYLLVLNLNPVRFRWGFRRGLIPMPTEVQEQAEDADRLGLLTARSILVISVVLLMRLSRISAYDVGLTAENWRFRLTMGLALSLIPVGLNAILLPRAPTKSVQKDLESRGPVGVWSGLIVLGSFSSEFWRAFCIVALLRSGVAAWLAIVIVAIFCAALWLQTSVARALGAAFYGGVAGTLFVYTGSLLAPLTMGLIASAAHFYRVRYTLRSIDQIKTNGGIEHRESRYSAPCPVCGAIIRLSEGHRSVDMLACPSCGESLTTEKKNLWVIAALSVVAAIYATRHLLYRDSGYLVVTEGLAFVFFFIGAFLLGILVPPKYKRVQGESFDNSLSLFRTDRPDPGNKSAQK
jgi:predicted RNA-binding Zn-ribbon protein involved in translation (DUF1610 family)